MTSFFLVENRTRQCIRAEIKYTEPLDAKVISVSAHDPQAYRHLFENLRQTIGNQKAGAIIALAPQVTEGLRDQTANKMNGIITK
jgi:hypothetical protein